MVYCAPVFKKQQTLLKKLPAVIWAGKEYSVQFPGHKYKKTIIGKLPLMIFKTKSDGCLSSQKNSIGNPCTYWKYIGTALAAPAAQH
jgi:hypothetical protein